jgi:hypothetical protein
MVGCTYFQDEWVGESGGCKTWPALRESVYSRIFPGRRLPTASSALQTASSSAVKTEVKKLIQHLTTFPFKINTNKVDPFIRDS